METSPLPSLAKAGPPIRRVIVSRPGDLPARRPRWAKRLFLLFCIAFLLTVAWFVLSGN